MPSCQTTGSAGAADRTQRRFNDEPPPLASRRALTKTDADDQIARPRLAVTSRDRCVGRDKPTIVARSADGGSSGIHSGARESRCTPQCGAGLIVAVRSPCRCAMTALRREVDSKHIDRSRRRSPAELRAERRHHRRVSFAPTRGCSHLFGRRGLDDDAGHDTFDGIRGGPKVNGVASDEGGRALVNERFRHWSSRSTRTARSCSCWRSPCRRASPGSRRNWPFRRVCTRSRSEDQCGRDAPRL